MTTMKMITITIITTATTVRLAMIACGFSCSLMHYRFRARRLIAQLPATIHAYLPSSHFAGLRPRVGRGNAHVECHLGDRWTGHVNGNNSLR